MKWLRLDVGLLKPYSPVQKIFKNRQIRLQPKTGLTLLNDPSEPQRNTQLHLFIDYLLAISTQNIQNNKKRYVIISYLHDTVHYIYRQIGNYILFSFITRN